MNEPTVSLIVTSYNQKDLLRNALESALQQTKDFHQIVVVDDCSTDGSPECLKELAQREPKITLVLRPQNGGLSEARNSGLDAATGEYVAFLDGDDWLTEHACESMTHLVAKDRPDLGVYNWQCINDETGEHVSTLKRQPFLTEDGLHTPIPSSDDDIALLFKWAPSAWLKVHRMEFLQRENLRFDGRIYEDLTWHFQTLVLAKSIRCTPEKLTYYRLHSNSVLNTKSMRHFEIFDIYAKAEAFVHSQPNIPKVVSEMFRRHRFNIMCFTLNRGLRIPNDQNAAFAKKILSIKGLTNFEMQPYEQEFLSRLQEVAEQEAV